MRYTYHQINTTCCVYLRLTLNIGSATLDREVACERREIEGFTSPSNVEKVISVG